MHQPGRQEILEHHYERIETTSRFRCYERNDAEACHELADFLEKKKKKFKEAFEVYKANCLKNEHGDSCFQYGQFLFYGRGVEKDIGEAFKAQVKGCNVKKFSGGACDTVGVQYLSEKVYPEIQKIRGKRDPKKAMRLFERGCDGNDGVACAHAAVAYRKGVGEFVKPDPVLGFKYSQRACDLRIRDGCLFVSLAYKAGEGVEQNEKLSDYYKRQYDLMSGGARPGNAPQPVKNVTHGQFS